MSVFAYPQSRYNILDDNFVNTTLVCKRIFIRWVEVSEVPSPRVEPQLIMEIILSRLSPDLLQTHI